MKRHRFYYAFRDSITGHFCTRAHAERNPKTTQRCRIYYK